MKLKPDDFIKKKVFDEKNITNYYQVIMKKNKLDFWLTLAEYEESDMIFNYELNKRLENLGFAEPF